VSDDAGNVPVIKPVDPGAPPMPCGMDGCTRDSAYITTVHIGTAPVDITSCDEHVPVMAEAVDTMASGRGIWTLRGEGEHSE
jgi:hypothetical protein